MFYVIFISVTINTQKGILTKLNLTKNNNQNGLHSHKYTIGYFYYTLEILDMVRYILDSQPYNINKTNMITSSLMHFEIHPSLSL